MFDFLNVPTQHTYCSEYYNSPFYLTSTQTYEWLNLSPFWTMIYRKVNDFYWLNHYNGNNRISYTTGNSKSKLPIRPVVNIKKFALGDKTTYNLGEEIIYKGQKYNVLYNTNNQQDYVTALKHRPLTKTEMYADLIENNVIQFYSSDECNMADDITNGCTNNYNDSFIKSIIDNWSNENTKSSDLVEIDGYKSRILTKDELMDNLGYAPTYISTDEYIMRTENTPEFVYDSSSPYWIISGNEDKTLSEKVTEYYENTYVNDRLKIRPVINLSKCALGDKECETMVCREGTKPVYEYKVGDIVTINNSRYVVLEDVQKKQKQVQLSALDVLSLEQINNYNKTGYQSEVGEVPYDYNCYTLVGSEMDEWEIINQCSVAYEDSTVKKIVDAWATDTFKEGFIESNLLSEDLLINALKYNKREDCRYNQWGDIYCTNIITTTDDNPSEIKNSNYSSFFANKNIFSLTEVFKYGKDGADYINPYETAHIRPVITVDRCLIDGGCENVEYISGCEDEEGNITPIVPPEDEPENVVEVENTLSLISKVCIFLSVILMICGVAIFLYNYKKTIKERNKI